MNHWKARRFGLILGLVAWLHAGFSFACLAAENEPASERIPLCILPLQNATGNPDLSHWGKTSQFMLIVQLSDFKSLRITPRDSVDYGIRQAAADTEGALTTEQAMRIGKELQVSRVVWGRYDRRDQDWEITVRIGKVVDQTVSKELTAKGRAWSVVIDSMESQLLAELQPKSGPLHRDKPSLRWATSADALERYSQARADRLALAKAEEELQQAITLDPKFLEGHLGLAATFGSEGKYDSARKEIDQALALDTNEPEAHALLGTLLLFQNDMDSAVVEFGKSINLDPDQSEANHRLGEIYMSRGKMDQALVSFKAAKQANPFSFEASAGLAQADALKGDEAPAMAELMDAIRFAPTNTLQWNEIGGCYELLHDPYSAVQYYKQFMLAGRKAGLNPDKMNEFEKHVQELEARLTPHSLTYPMPQSFTPQELTAALQAKLTSDQFAQVTNPLASTPEMRAWAEKLARGLTNDVDKAQALFQGVSRQFRFADNGGYLGAREVFARMADKTATVNCLEGAHLYVALGRDIGLHTFMAEVDRDYEGHIVQHCCAALFMTTNVLLVDPSYEWFGVPHKEVIVLDDIQAIGINYFDMGGPDAKTGLARFQIAEKIYPNSEIGLFNHINALFRSGQWEEARNLIPAALKASHQGWMLAEEAGILAQHDGEDDLALSLFMKGSQANPDDGVLHLNLAMELLNHRRLSEARDEFQAALRHDLTPQDRDKALQGIAIINDRLSSR